MARLGVSHWTRSVMLLAAIFAVGWPQPGWSQDSSEPLVVILPLGKVDRTALEQVAQAIRDSARVRTRIDPARPLPKAAWYPPRRRWRAEKLLRTIDVDPPDGAWKVVAVTEAEISTTKGSIVDWGIGGLGNIGDRSCVVSTYLLRKHTPRSDSGKLRERLRKLAIHELGHTLGLDHCPVFGCVMNDAQGKLIRSLDTGGETFCGRCRKRLPAQAVRREPELEPVEASTNAANAGQSSGTTARPTSP